MSLRRTGYRALSEPCPNRSLETSKASGRWHETAGGIRVSDV